MAKRKIIESDEEEEEEEYEGDVDGEDGDDDDDGGDSEEDKSSKSNGTSSSSKTSNLVPMPSNMTSFVMSLVSLSCGSLLAQVPTRKRDQFRSRLRELALRQESSLDNFQLPAFKNVDLDTLHRANKTLKEIQTNLGNQVHDLEYQNKDLTQKYKDAEKWIQDNQVKSKRVKSAHSSKHKELHSSLKQYPDQEETLFNFPALQKQKRVHTQITVDEESDDDELEVKEDKELEDIKRKLAPKLSKIAKAQKTSQTSFVTVGQALDAAEVLIRSSADKD